jgi:6-phosphogluconolactonase
MELKVVTDPDSTAQLAAATIAADARAAVAARGRFTLAVSGGHTPWIMLRMLAKEDIPWAGVHLYQVDERIAPDGHPDRNLTHIRENLLLHAPLRPDQIHAMPVESADRESAAAQYSMELQEIAGRPPVLDVVHLGLGPDGHTASLVPADAVLHVTNSDVSLTGVYQGRRRMTLTYPAINRALRLLFLVTGSEKTQMLQRLVDGDTSIPAGSVSRERILLLADRAAAGQLMMLRMDKMRVETATSLVRSK